MVVIHCTKSTCAISDIFLSLFLQAGLSSIWGIIAVMAIGGGDMPVSISFLNSLSGFSTSAAGFMTVNKSLVISGAFVGCSGIILTLVMCDAMNRSIVNVLVGGFGEGSSSSSGASKQAAKVEGSVTEVSAEDVAETLTSSKSIIIVPGYGMAVAKAQHAIADMTESLRARGINVRFAIHPVAGRLPGHMNGTIMLFNLLTIFLSYILLIPQPLLLSIPLVHSPPCGSQSTLRHHFGNG